MKAQYAAELTEGSRVDTTFVVRAKEMRSTRSGEAFLALELADRTGQIPAVWFRPGAAAAAVPVSTVVQGARHGHQLPRSEAGLPGGPSRRGCLGPR